MLANKYFRRSMLVALIASCAMGFTSLSAGKRIAVVFGTNYKGNTGGIPPLDLCERDAQLMEQTLRKHGRFDDAKAILGQQVTAANVRAELNKLAGRITPEDTIVFFFAGHGTYQRDAKAPNGLRNTLVMFDRPHLGDDELNDLLKKINTKKFLWVFDCCFSGGIVKKGRRGSGDVPVDKGAKGAVIQDGADNFYFKDKVLVGSSDSNETSIEIGGKINHGIFSYWFAKGINNKEADLNRDQAITALEAFEWSSRRITDMAKKFNHRQHPQMAGNASGIILAGEVAKPKPPKKDPDPPVVPEPPKKDQPKPSPQPEPPSPTKPPDPVTPDEPPVVEHEVKSDIHLYTTILKSRKAGINTMNPIERIRAARMADETRKIRVLVSGKDYETKVDWVDRRGLKRASGEDVPLGDYTNYGKVYKNQVAVITIKQVPTGVHELEIQADDYPVIKRRLGVEKDRKKNDLFVVASVAGSGSIQGRVFLKNFEQPLKGQEIWMPTVTAPNIQPKMKSLSDGSFWFLNLPPDKYYQLKPSFLEANPVENRYLEVKANGVTKVDVVLQQSGGSIVR